MKFIQAKQMRHLGEKTKDKTATIKFGISTGIINLFVEIPSRERLILLKENYVLEFLECFCTKKIKLMDESLFQKN
jgi:hypothetical protein